jgi:hypothetical protein
MTGMVVVVVVVVVSITKNIMVIIAKYFDL